MIRKAGQVYNFSSHPNILEGVWKGVMNKHKKGNEKWSVHVYICAYIGRLIFPKPLISVMLQHY